jgi:hypothetical protein
MWKFINFIERHKFGVLTAITIFIALYMYFQMQTYEGTFVISSWEDETVLEKEEIEIKPENIEVDPQAMTSGDVKSIAKNANDERQTSNENWDRNKSSSQSAAEKIKNLEKQYYAETGESQKRDVIRKQLEEAKKQQKTDAKADSKTKSDQNAQGGNTAFKGKTMVDYSLRDPFQNNEWWVRNPGYTCGYGSSG